jgi:anti-sigma B factor antagonist
MEMQFSDIGIVRKVVFVGRLDTAGVDRVETRFGAAVVAAGKNTVVDLSQVTFLASLGIRMLITTARSLSRKRAKLVMYGATPAVMEIIDTTALHEIIPVAGSEDEAVALVSGGEP